MTDKFMGWEDDLVTTLAEQIYAFSNSGKYFDQVMPGSQDHHAYKVCAVRCLNAEREWELEDGNREEERNLRRTIE